MGGMINVFDLNAEMGGTKLLSDRARRDGSSCPRNRSDAVKESMDPKIVQAENKHVIITDEMRKSSSAKKSLETPMKMLLAQGMSKESECKRKQPNVIARLMGLDESLPAYQSLLNGEGKLDRRDGSSHRKDGYFDRVTPCKVHSCTHEVKYTDEYEVHLKREARRRKGMCDEIDNEKRMALVRQKFMEAKWLATDEKLLRSKEFQDAVEVLSSNRDLFLKFLEEPMSLFSKHLRELHSTPDSHETKRITILKPSRTLEVKGDDRWEKKVQSSSSMTQSTRIVILKPSPVKHHDTKPMRKKDDFYQVLEDTESVGSRNAANDITQQMTESVGSIRRDESLLSSVLSNGYVGDESSFNKSENEYEREDGNFSDSPRHSLDYSNRFGSPYSLSSFSRTSCSPERSMIREAKKLLSERWTLVASNVNNREELAVKKSSSTLGEMLGVANQAKLEVPSLGSSTCQSDIADGAESSNLNLLRSKSVPDSSVSERIALTPEVLDLQIKKPIIPKDTSRSKNRGKSFNWMVSSLFFSRNKKGGRDYGSQPDKCSSPKSDGDSIKVASKEGTISLRDVLSLEKRSATQSSSDNQNQNQPSLTSVQVAPIKSVARTLSRDDTNLDALSPPDTLFSLVHNILSTTGLDREKPSTFFSKWHSVDSPLDPNLLGKFLDRKEENARNRERRSNQRLAFDCVNSALLEVGIVRMGARRKHVECGSIEDEVGSLVRDWFFGKVETENSGLVVDKLLREAVRGRGWIESMRSEIDAISEDIGGEVLKDLVAEVLECLSH